MFKIDPRAKPSHHSALSEPVVTQPSNGQDRRMYQFVQCRAAQYMTRSVVSVTRETPVSELGALFERHDFNSFPVLEDGNLLGIVTKFDFLRAFAFSTAQMLPHYDELVQQTAAEIMTEAVIHVEPETPLTRILQLMVSLKMRSFPVLGPARQLLGIISREDVIRALREATQSTR